MSAPARGPEARPALLWLAPALGYAALIFWLSHQQNPLPELTAAFYDKALHAVEYAGLAGLLALGLGRPGRGGPVRGPIRAALLAMALAAAYGLSDEAHQAFVPGRDASLLDWAFDLAGAVVGGILAVPFLRWVGVRASIRA